MKIPNVPRIEHFVNRTFVKVVAASTRWIGCAAVGCEKLYTKQGEWHFSKLLVCKYAPISNNGIRRPYFQGKSF